MEGLENPVAPEPLPPPVLTACVKRTCEVVVQGHVHPMSCLVSESGAVYAVVRTLRDCIYGKVKQGVLLEPVDGYFHAAIADGAEYKVAIKVINRRRLAQGLSEDPIKEIAVMQVSPLRQLVVSPSSPPPNPSPTSPSMLTRLVSAFAPRDLCPQSLGQAGDHPNVIGLIEALQDADNIYLILPYCDGGELCQWFLEKRYMLPNDTARALFMQILSGLSYLHNRKVVHHDLSLENLLWDSHHRRCVIIDLGMCVKLPVRALPEVVVRRQGAYGKIKYMAPEIYADEDFIAPAVDLWALGVSQRVGD